MYVGTSRDISTPAGSVFGGLGLAIWQTATPISACCVLHHRLLEAHYRDVWSQLLKMLRLSEAGSESKPNRWWGWHVRARQLVEKQGSVSGLVLGQDAVAAISARVVFL